MRFNPSPIRKRTPPGLARVTYANEIADAVNNQTPSFIVGCEDQGFAPGLVFVAKITDKGPNGEADYGNNQHWCEAQIVVAGMANDQATLDALHGLTPFTIVTVTNLCTSGHILKKDDVVFVRAEVDKSDPPKIRFVICAPPSNVVVDVDVAKDGGAAGSRSAMCTFTYTAKFAGTSIVIGVNLSPKSSPCRGFPMKVNTVATEGMLSWRDGTPVLKYVNESTGNKGCG